MIGFFSLFEFIDVVFLFFFDFVNDWFIFFIMYMDNFSRNIDNCYIIRYVCYNNCCSIDFGIFIDFYWFDNLGMG